MNSIFVKQFSEAEIIFFQEPFLWQTERREQEGDQGGGWDERVSQTAQEDPGQWSEGAGDRGPLESQLLWRPKEDDYRRGSVSVSEHRDHPPQRVGEVGIEWWDELEHRLQERQWSSKVRFS